MKKKDKKEENSEKQNAKKKETDSIDSVIQEISELDEKTQKYDGLWDKFVRLQAEFDNYKKRSYKEKMEFVKYANEGLIMELLGILDNFERGVKAAELKKDFDLLHQGVDMISKQLHSLLESKGLIRIKSINEKFDPHQHEAVEVVEDDKVCEDAVIEELQAGYTLNGRILRPAKVKVRKFKMEKEEEKNEEKEEEVEEGKEEGDKNNKV